MNNQDKRKKTSTRQRATHRIKIIQGHLKSIEKMIDEGAYCVDIIHQSRAVQKALKNMDLLIIEQHLKGCVVEQIHNGDESKTTEELLKLFDYK
jgi:DNA-binding FrmR family transcriptional regulator